MKAQRNKKIEIISFMAMLCVVWWHCYCGSQVERWFIPGVCVWSVPWFFFLSGVLFRRTLDTKGRGEVVASKVRSLLIPYILWCAIGAVLTSFVRQGGGGGSLHSGSRFPKYIHGEIMHFGMCVPC